MGLENVTLINSLVETNPASGDQKSEGDDHLRNIKKALKATFPNISEPVLATAAKLNGSYVPIGGETFQLLGDTPMIEFHNPGVAAWANYMRPVDQALVLAAISNGAFNSSPDLVWVLRNGRLVASAGFDAPNTASTMFMLEIQHPVPQINFFDTDEGYRRYINVNQGNLNILSRTGGTLHQSRENGDWWSSGNVIGYSDERVKKNWRNLAPDFLLKLAEVKSGVYDRTDMLLTQVGVSAQSLQAVLPEAVVEGKDERLSVAYGNAALVACIELAREVKALRERIMNLERR